VPFGRDRPLVTQFADAAASFVPIRGLLFVQPVAGGAKRWLMQ
jgi:hypothetical protein